MAEVHIIGQIIGANGFPNHNLCCKWGIHAGGGWKHLEGLTSGQTQVDNPHFEEFAYWSHPIDIHFAVKGLQGWPKLDVQVWHQDVYGRMELWGYGFIYVPTTPGYHKLECVTWRPSGSMWDELSRFFLGGGPQLRNSEVVYNACDRYKLQTVAMGKVHFELNVILRNFSDFGVEV